MQVLIVEDETRMAALLEKGLRAEGHSVVAVGTGVEALEAAQSYTFDVIVLDIMVPRLDGFEVARRLRERRNQTPILMLTALDAPTDKVKGLDLGADDYLTKPFLFNEFLARLRTVSRRGPILRPAVLKVADLTLDPATHQVFRNKRLIELTPTEFALLELLMRNAGRVLERDAIIAAVWNTEESVEDSNLNAFISLLRQKVDRDGAVQLIQTVRGVGYRGFDQDSAERWLDQGKADLIAFGRKFLANPDLPKRFRQRAPLNADDPTTYYGGGAKGYVDYPTLGPAGTLAFSTGIRCW